MPNTTSDRLNVFSAIEYVFSLNSTNNLVVFFEKKAPVVVQSSHRGELFLAFNLDKDGTFLPLASRKAIENYIKKFKVIKHMLVRGAQDNISIEKIIGAAI